MIDKTTTAADLLDAIRDALAADQALIAWCRQQFSKDPGIWLGMDENNPPKADQYPLIAVIGLTQARGDDKRELVWEITLGVALIQEEIVETGITRTFTGMLQAETLRELAEDALYRARLIGTESDGESATLSHYPLFLSLSTLTFKTLKTTRRGLPAR